MAQNQDLVCLLLVAGYPVIAGILLYHSLKLKKDAQKKTRNPKEKVLHRKPRRNQDVKEGEKNPLLQLSLIDEPKNQQ